MKTSVQWLKENAGVFASDRETRAYRRCLGEILTDLTKDQLKDIYDAIPDEILKAKLIIWMKEWVQDDFDYEGLNSDLFLTLGELNLNQLVLEAILESDLIPAQLETTVLEDETHPIWCAAVDVSDWWEQHKLDLIRQHKKIAF